MVHIYWRTYFDGLLPPGADGIFVILENNCDQQYTYQVDGVNSWFIGHGDLHDTKYDYLGISTSIDDIWLGEGNGDSNHGAGGEQVGCQYSIRVYPSQEFEDYHHTNTPWIFAVTLAALFLFTSAVFLFYDYMVERRQKIVLQSAQQSGKLVSSLFPEAVRDQLYEEQRGKANDREPKPSWETKANQQLPRSSDLTMDIEHKKAIATLYPETTVSTNCVRSLDATVCQRLAETLAVTLTLQFFVRHSIL